MVVPVLVLGILAATVLIGVTTLTTDWWELLFLVGMITLIYAMYLGKI